jgi:hypothetical protein
MIFRCIFNKTNFERIKTDFTAEHSSGDQYTHLIRRYKLFDFLNHFIDENIFMKDDLYNLDYIWYQIICTANFQIEENLLSPIYLIYLSVCKLKLLTGKMSKEEYDLILKPEDDYEKSLETTYSSTLEPAVFKAGIDTLFNKINTIYSEMLHHFRYCVARFFYMPYEALVPMNNYYFFDKQLAKTVTLKVTKKFEGKYIIINENEEIFDDEVRGKFDSENKSWILSNKLVIKENITDTFEIDKVHYKFDLTLSKPDKTIQFSNEVYDPDELVKWDHLFKKENYLKKGEEENEANSEEENEESSEESSDDETSSLESSTSRSSSSPSSEDS